MNRNLMALAVSTLLAVSCSTKNHQESSPSQPLLLNDSLRQIVSIDTTRLMPLQNELILNGKVTFNPEEEAHVYPMFGGTILSVHVEIGDYVKKGDLLATIRSGEIADFEKQEKEAGQQLILAQRNLDATQDMFNSGMSSERDLLQARQEVVNAQAEQQRIVSLYSIYHIEGNSTYTIKSPVSGFVIDKQANREMQIRSDQGEELFTISGLHEVWIMADVYESDIPKIAEGDSVRIKTLAYKDKIFFGKIDKIYNMLDDDSKTMKVRVKLRNEDFMLKPGMFTNVYVSCQAKGGARPRIPAKAVIFENGRYYVVYVSQEGYLEKHEVQVYKQNSDYCYLQEGLQEGDRIVNKNALLIYNALK